MKNQSAILQMFYEIRGSLNHCQPSKSYFQLQSQKLEYENELKRKLENLPECIELYDKIEDIDIKSRSEEIDCYFSEGFRFGALIGIDIMTPPNE